MNDFLKKRLAHINAGRPAPEKKKYYIPKQSAKKKATIAADKQARIDNGGMTNLEKWYDKAGNELAKNPYCMECKQPIHKEYFRHATAHILPKKIFKSVATHILNKLFLGAGCGCHNKSHTWDTFQKMKVWKEAVRRFILIEPDIAQEERKFIPNILLDEIKNPFN